MKKVIEFIEILDWAKIFYLIPLALFWILIFMFLNKSFYLESMCIAVVIIAWKIKGKHNES